MNRVFDEVIERAKNAFGCPTDKDLAELIGISPQALNNRKKTGSIPYEQIIASATQRGADLQYILTGIRSNMAAEQHPGYAVLNPRETMLLDNYRHIADEEDKRCVERTALLAAKADKKEGTNG
jgi:hypothetical protein